MKEGYESQICLLGWHEKQFPKVGSQENNLFNIKMINKLASM